ncbi:MAG TPA: molybdopterin-dependent oxidoreductase [Gemmatimonas sp.]|nr:molybdopterin-dependent oxidoreductase [Gemmatimonas sp.]
MKHDDMHRVRRRAAMTAIDRAVSALEDATTRPTHVSLAGRIDHGAVRAFDRRHFLRVGSSALATAFLSACGLAGNDDAKRVIAYASRKNESVERWLFRHTAINVGSPGASVAGAKFPAYFVSPVVPVWGTARGPWTLAVSGMVARPASLSLEALMSLPRARQRVEHFCVEGWNALANFTGVRVSELARRAGASPNARFVDFQSFDGGYHESWDIESALHDQTLIVYGKDGELLTAPFGAPARLHSPVKLGYKNTKYLTRIVFMRESNGGYWTDRGYEWYGGT